MHILNLELKYKYFYKWLDEYFHEFLKPEVYKCFHISELLHMHTTEHLLLLSETTV